MASRTIFVIDDDPTAQAILCGSLSANGYETLVADSGRHVLQRIREHAPDLIITDIFMDDQEGLETIMQVRASYDSIPIIAISSNPDYLAIAIEMGADTTLLKPIDVRVLLRSVAALLSNRSTGAD